MISMNIQFFGGRGQRRGGGGGGKRAWSNGLGMRVYGTAAEALGTQGEPLSISEAVKKANPNYNSEYREYSENCQRCVTAYEARRRGYDVVAHATYEDDTMPMGGNWLDCYEGGREALKNVGGANNKRVAKNIETEMLSYGNGARAIVRVRWQGLDSGHVFNVENQGGKIIYSDAQVGSFYKNAKEALEGSAVHETQLVRVDNLNFTEKVAQAVTKEH